MIAVRFMSLFERLQPLNPTAREFTSGAHLFRRRDEVSVLHLVVGGEADLVRYRADGRTLVLQRARPDMVLAEASIFSERYHCDCVAVVPTRTLAVARSAVRMLLTVDPGFAEAWALHLAHELQATRLRAEILSLRTVAERLDALSLTHAGGRISGREVHRPGRHLGAMAGAFREVARRLVAGRALQRSRARRRLRPARRKQDSTLVPRLFGERQPRDAL